MKETINIKTVAAIFVIGLAGGVAGFGISCAIEGDNNKTIAIQDTETTAIPTSLPTYYNSAVPTEFTSAADKCIDGVVHVKTKYVDESQQGFDDPFLQYFFGMPKSQPQESQASGSGVIISTDGYIVTNNHVIENSTNIEVVLNDRRSYTATLIGRDPSTDIALLKIEADDLTAIPFGSSDNLKVGEWVLAIGNPFNLTSTVTSGIVSAKARNINILDRRAGAIESFIQTDAAVNPGNSGGALVNTNGELVGINTAIASQTGSFVGYSFAVPSTIVQKVIADLREYGKVQRALIGVQIQDLTAELAEENNLNNMNGVYVAEVIKHSAADDAGISNGDIILSINNKNTNTVAQLQEVVSTFRPGDKATITFIHKGERRDSQITFKDKENNTELIAASKEIEMLGASFEEADNSVLKKIGLKHGVQVTDLQSGKFLSSGMRKGFIITAINNKPITSIADIKNAISGHKGGVYIEGVYPNGREAYYAFGL